MKSKSKVLQKYSDSGFRQFIIIVSLFFWGAFAFYKWESNPTFFLVTVIIAGLLFFTISYQSIVLREDGFDVNNSRLIPFFGYYMQFEYAEIKSLKLERGDTTGEMLFYRFLFGRLGNAKAKMNTIIIETEKDGVFEVETKWSVYTNCNYKTVRYNLKIFLKMFYNFTMVNADDKYV